ncbi:Cholesterol dehydrogenase [Chryseobacterium gleum]|uniref:Cholesterol dehydrogenase n=2 Tax=Chryseobacterium gleum TaxID=250 RepID=A0A448B8C7_CHRGE|nr:NAD-dependent epimerase/dehydratase family protein [Chryseobacterium gleum]EFK36681.1 NAD dependent epimerase/dehydratase family protein [Chryseobacterium gleum ATCC 35910]QQY31947.1 NAD-dependent epimerase/dehydratase family protein [Chryseobacterium gleum]VEE10841.1 Cholesterol dehydrogenase [Chryseobacterium gleum]
MKKILITGITGYIGGSIAKKLLERNYEVTGLVRNESHVQELESLGIKTVVGNIHNEDLIKTAVAGVDAVIHNADSADDAYAVDNFIKALEGSHKTFIFTSGSAIFGGKENGRRSDFVYREDYPLTPRLEMASRVLINNYVLQSVQKDIRSIVIVPTMVYGEGLGIKKDSIQIPALINFSQKKGHGVYFGEGENIWSNLHIEDLADLYVLALEKAKEGSIYYAENGASSLKNIAEIISKKYHQQPARSLSIQDAVDNFGPAGGYFGFASNSICSADKARTELGWKPVYNSIENFI